jgi:hypothetical protein
MQSNDSTEGNQKKKTWGREVAFLILVWFFYIVETKDVEYTKILSLPVFTFVFAAYGLKRVTTDTELFQRASFTTDGRGSERSSQYSVRKDEHPDDRQFYTAEFRPQSNNSYNSRDIRKTPDTTYGTDT